MAYGLKASSCDPLTETYCSKLSQTFTIDTMFISFWTKLLQRWINQQFEKYLCKEPLNFWWNPEGVLKLFFDGVCGPKSETPTHV